MRDFLHLLAAGIVAAVVGGFLLELAGIGNWSMCGSVVVCYVAGMFLGRWL